MGMSMLWRSLLPMLPSWRKLTKQTASGWFNGDDAVVLRKGTTVIDVIGQIGFDPGSEWGSWTDQHCR